MIDRAARELDAARAEARGVRGAARQALLERLAALDAELVAEARRALGAAAIAELQREADDELASLSRAAWPPTRYAARRPRPSTGWSAQRLALPTIAFT